jgi:hypothetical protein
VKALLKKSVNRPSCSSSSSSLANGSRERVVPSDPLDLNFTLTKRADWGGSGLKDRFMARSCPAVDLIANAGDYQDDERVETCHQNVKNRRRQLEEVEEETCEEDACSEVDRLLELISKVAANAGDVRGRFCQLVEFEAQIDRLVILGDSRSKKVRFCCSSCPFLPQSVSNSWKCNLFLFTFLSCYYDFTLKRELVSVVS